MQIEIDGKKMRLLRGWVVDISGDPIADVGYCRNAKDAAMIARRFGEPGEIISVVHPRTKRATKWCIGGLEDVVFVGEGE